MRPSPTLLRACGRGNRLACVVSRRLHMMYAASILTFKDVKEDTDNPNHLPFEGTLLLTDVASDKPPHGSEGHRIFVSKQAALDAMKRGLVGQAVNYQPEGLNAHASRHKVGVITKAWMDGNKVKVAGFIWVHDFPEARILKNRSDLGMSMELAQVYVQDEDADIWNLSKFDFTGGTILKKDAAAYTQTSLAAQAAATPRKGDPMPDKNKKKVAAAHRDTGQRVSSDSLVRTLSTAISNAMAPVVTEIKASTQRFEEGLEEIRGLHLSQIHAAAERDLEDEDDDEIVVHGAAHEDSSSSASASAAEEEEAEMEASASGSASASVAAARQQREEDDSSSSSSAAADDDLEAMEDLSLEDADQEPGEVNRDVSSRGSKTHVTKPPTQGEHFSGNVAKGRLHAKGGRVFPNVKRRKVAAGQTTTIQAAALIGDLQASIRQVKRQMRAQATEHATEVHGLKKQLRRMQAQAARFAEQEGRRSVISHELVALGEKVGVDFNELQISGSKLNVRAFDSILAAAEQNGIILGPQQRITMKMLAEQHGLLDEGAVTRGMGRA